ncbi:hypothetical protein RRF68_11185 [Tenacibaculum sp. HL-MS23]|uniref:hypothetical protein n=1 Tax=Tenacibaculum sp. HL-MS23 TaxID=3077734 RepID=UPI0028FC2A8B|nr:hypothetical protein [Tenacibaculum sp. HL-MS23]WNW01546.1 hypothetical protein RRF68_11185 [Tenacibaculum sp. HL-MS23]
MIDYVKILFKNIDINQLYNLPYLDFETIVNLKTGEPTTKKTVMYHFCKITIYENGTVLFTGSIHKFHNSLKGIKAPNYNEQSTYKGYNGNQFTINDIFAIRTHLQNLFNCSAGQMVFQNIEFGVNTTPYFNPQLFIKGLLFHKGKLFEYRYKDRFAQVKHQRYYVKIYNKSEQYGITENTLRIELKIMKTEFLKQTGIRTFAEVTEETLNKAKELLLKVFDEVNYYDYTVIKKDLSKLQKESLKNYSNPRYWIYDLKPQHRHRHIKKLNHFITTYSNNLQTFIKQDINQKCVIINRLFKEPNCVIINTSYIRLNTTQKDSIKSVNKCIVTGIDLSKEKDDAKYIRVTTLKYLMQYEIKTFYKLCSLFLKNTKPNHTRYENNLITHLAKQIRNRFYNKYEIKQTGYKSKIYNNQYTLNFTQQTARPRHYKKEILNNFTTLYKNHVLDTIKKEVQISSVRAYKKENIIET